MKRSAMKPGKPMKRGTPLLRSRMKRKAKRVSAQERAEYAASVDAYRDPEGFARCADCGRGLLDREIHRHHVFFRSQGGKTVRANILPLCERCHGCRHGITVISPTARNGAVEDGDAPRLGGVELPLVEAPIG